MEVKRGKYSHFEHRVEWVEECQDDFSIRATEPLEDTKPILRNYRDRA